MNAKENIFIPLLQRLTSLSEDSLHIPDFDFQSLINKLRTNLIIDTPNDSLSQIKKGISMIDHLLDANRDFFVHLFELKTETVTCPDEYGNLNLEETQTHVTLPKWQRENVNSVIRLELAYYKNHLTQFQNLPILNREYLVKKQKSKTIQKNLPYVHSVHPGNVKVLFNALQKNQFIDKSVEWKDFKKVFLGDVIPSCKIYWTGGRTRSGVSTLSYFIRQLFKSELVVGCSTKVEWETVYNIFTLSEDGSEIQNDLNSQKKPQKEYKLLDKIILDFSKK